MPLEVRDAIASSVVNALSPIYVIVICMVVLGLGVALKMKEVLLTNRMVPKAE